VKLADFGLSTFAPTNRSVFEIAGTQSYMAPEMFAQRGYGKPVDMWAMGVILYVVLSGLLPYDVANRKFECEFVSPEFDHISESAQELIWRLMDKNSDSRMTVDEALEHPWVQGATATEKPIGIERLREFNARRRFKKAAFAIRSTLRMKGMIGSFKEKAENIVERKKSPLATVEQNLQQIHTQLKEIQEKAIIDANKVSAEDRKTISVDTIVSLLNQIQVVAKFDKLRAALNLPKSDVGAPTTDLAKELELAEAHVGAEYGQKVIADLQKLKEELLQNIKSVDEIRDNIQKIPSRK